MVGVNKRPALIIETKPPKGQDSVDDVERRIVALENSKRYGGWRG